MFGYDDSIMTTLMCSYNHSTNVFTLLLLRISSHFSFCMVCFVLLLLSSLSVLSLLVVVVVVVVGVVVVVVLSVVMIIMNVLWLSVVIITGRQY